MDRHNDTCYKLKKENESIDIRHLQQTEFDLITRNVNLKELLPLLEVKMSKQLQINLILRVLCLLSITQSGLKKDDFNRLKRVLIMNYGYQEATTLAQLQEA